MVVDELIAFLKDRMYASDALYSTLVLDRFFRILSDAKYLFHINADGSFVLSLIFFKMVEALRIKEVDQMIESLQKEIYRPAISCATPINLPKDENQSQHEENVPKENLHVENTLHQNTFTQLVSKIKDRNSELGECFERSISFISYENEMLTWESCANDECKKILTHGYGVIKQLVREVFGFETKIKHEACSKTPKEESIMQSEAVEDEPASMIEEVEIGGSASCVTNCQSNDSSREINGADILEEPMVQKATELFEATKRTVQLKI
jgi:DNA polymerase-3 subunit gamma/tau